MLKLMNKQGNRTLAFALILCMLLTVGSMITPAANAESDAAGTDETVGTSYRAEGSDGASQTGEDGENAQRRPRLPHEFRQGPVIVLCNAVPQRLVKIEAEHAVHDARLGQPADHAGQCRLPSGLEIVLLSADEDPAYAQPDLPAVLPERVDDGGGGVRRIRRYADDMRIEIPFGELGPGVAVRHAVQADIHRPVLGGRGVRLAVFLSEPHVGGSLRFQIGAERPDQCIVVAVERRFDALHT